MSIKDSRREGVQFILLWMFVLLLIAIGGHIAKAQEFDLAKADSLWIERYNDSLFQVAARVTMETGEELQVKTRPYDSLTVRQYVVNIGIQANSRILDAYRVLMSGRRIGKLTSSVSQALVGFVGLTFRQEQERLFISGLAPCGTGGQCEGFYNFRQDGVASKRLRIRDNASVREVTAGGATVSGGIQGNIQFVAGIGLFVLNVTAGPADLIGKKIEFALAEQRSVDDKEFWSSPDGVFRLVRQNQ